MLNTSVKMICQVLNNRTFNMLMRRMHIQPTLFAKTIASVVSSLMKELQFSAIAGRERNLSPLLGVISAPFPVLATVQQTQCRHGGVTQLRDRALKASRHHL